MNAIRMLGAVALGGVLLVGVAGPATAAPSDVIDGGAAGLLWLEVDAPGVQDLDPGQSGYRLVTLHLDTEPVAPLAVQVTSQGALAEHPDGLRIAMDECSAPWVDGVLPGDAPSCPGTLSSPFAAVAMSTLSPSGWGQLGTLVQGTARYLRVSLTLPDPLPSVLSGEHADYRIAFSAAGDSAEVDGPSTTTGLPWTGVAIAVPLGLALLLGGAGALLRATDRRRAS